MRKLLYCLAFVTAMGLCGACGQTGGTARGDSTALRLGVLPTMECLPFFYADSVGLFDSLGIRIRLVTFDAAMDADTAFRHGRVDGIVTDQVKACVWQANGDSVCTALEGDLRLWLVTAMNARLTKAASLKEKVVGITRHSALDFFTDQILASAKMESIDLNKPQINNIRLRMLMVDQNQYDGAILPEPHASEAVARGARRLDGTADLQLAGMMCVLFGDSVAQARRDEVGKIREAYDRAVAALNADTLSRPLDFFPRTHAVALPDTLFTYTPLAPSHAASDSLKQRIRTWAKGRGLIK